MLGMKWLYTPAPKNDAYPPAFLLVPARASISARNSNSDVGGGMFSDGLRCSAGMSSKSRSIESIPIASNISSRWAGVLGI